LYFEPQSSSSADSESSSQHVYHATTVFEQIERMHNIDIVIAPHGAAITNVIFLKPCSVLIEIYPWNYLPISFFHRFTTASGVLHYPIIVRAESTVIHPTVHAHYSDIFQTNFTALFHTNDSFSTHERQTTINALCKVYVHQCNYAFRDITGFHVNITELLSVVDKALEDRWQCLLTHPFLN
jgi:hypothetical protein